MPSSPKKACPAPGCDKLVSRGYCPDHKQLGYQRDDAAKVRAKVYADRRWKALCRQVRREQPWCNVPGCNQLTNQVDHIVTLRTILANGGDPYRRDGVQGLCAFHHGQKTRAEQYGYKA